MKSAACLLLPVLAVAGCCHRCGELDVRWDSEAPGGAITATFPADVPLLEIHVIEMSGATADKHWTLWQLQARSSSLVSNPLTIVYAVVPPGMEESKKAVPLKEGMKVGVFVGYSTGSFWNPHCHKGRGYKVVEGRFELIWETPP